MASAVLLAGVASPALGYTFGSTVQQLGSEETVFDWDTQRCEDINIPDSPARAFRDYNNQVELTLSHYVNRRMTGPDLNNLTVNCTPTMTSDQNPDPSAFDDYEWIHSPFTLDGRKVYAIVHNEYHGWEYAGECSTQVFTTTCWDNSLTLATSTDGGATYTHTTPPTHLVASVPYVYVPDTGPMGYFTPSNVIFRKSDGYLYMLGRAEQYQLQNVGVCVMRTKTPGNPTSWRAWDGTGFNIQFVNPYIDPSHPEQHVCPPVSFAQIDKMSQDLIWSSFFGKWLLVGSDALYDPGTGQWTYGFFYSTSSDLIHWSQRQVLISGVLPWSYQCGQEDPINYPAVLDPNSTTRNFSTTGQTAYIYFTHFHYSNCIQTLDRDLVRVQFQFLGRPQPTSDPPPDY